MLPIMTVEQVRAAEVAANALGLSYAEMMQRAGAAVVEFVTWAGREKSVLLLIGTGNNGGDGLVAGIEYRRLVPDATVRAYLLKARADDDPLVEAAKQAGVVFQLATDDVDYQTLRLWTHEADVVIDALLGIGAKLPLRRETSRLLEAVSGCLAYERPNVSYQTPEAWNPEMGLLSHRTRRVVAVDCPTGLDCDTGEMDVATLPADDTVIFIGVKQGLLKSPALTAVGKLHVAGLGVLELLGGAENKTWLIEAEDVRRLLPPRSVDSNKGTYGKTLIVAGSRSYTGAAGLAATAAYRSGTGLVTVAAIPEVRAALAGAVLEATWLVLSDTDGYLTAKAEVAIREAAARYDALLVGCGIGLSHSTRGLIGALLSESNWASRLVLDADALNIAAEMHRWWQHLPAETVITPHPGEMARLCQTDTQTVQTNRWELARQKAAEWGVVVVLKGAHTAIAAPDGRLAVSPFKTDALAKAGTGDVLAGLIVGLLAQGMSAFDAALCGVYLHAGAGATLGESRGGRRTLASEIVNQFEQIP